MEADAILKMPENLPLCLNMATRDLSSLIMLSPVQSLEKLLGVKDM